MSNLQFIFKNRFNTYYFRQRTPKFILQQLPSAKKEVKISLKTKYRQTALILARAHKVKFDALFLEIRNINCMNESFIEKFSDLDEIEQQSKMLSQRALEAIQDQQYTQQLFFLFERKNRLRDAFNSFDILKGRSLNDIDLSSVIKINQFMAIIDLLSDATLSDSTPYLDQIQWKAVPENDYRESKNISYDNIEIGKLVINRKKTVHKVAETPTQLITSSTKNRNQVKETLLTVLNNDINDQPSAIRTQTDDVEDYEDVILENITLENEQDILNFAKLMSLIEKGEPVSVNDIQQCATPVIVPKSMLKMSEMFEKFYNVRSKEWASRTTHTSYLAIYRSFTEIIGDIFVENFDYTQANRYVDTLQEMPINRNKSKQFRNLSVDEILEFKGDYERLSTTSVNKYIGCISEAFDWAVKRGYLNNNLMKSQKIKNTQQKQRQKKNATRSRFTNEHLEAIFSAKEFTSGSYNRTYQFWTPLIALYTGARIQEISQLRLNDIYKQQGVWVFDLNEAEDKKLKTVNCIRLIPIHKRLISLGFIKYFQHLVHCYESDVLTSNLLFPDLLIGKGGYGHNSSKSFIRLLKRIGIKKAKVDNNGEDDGLVFHSFRHTFADEMKQSQLNPAMTAELLGHSLEGETLSRYGKDYAASTLKKEIDKYDPLSELQIKNIKRFKFWKELTPNNSMKMITEVDEQKSIYDNQDLKKAIYPRLNLPNRHKKIEG